ncbi:YciI family protein [Devosia sp. Root105]|uniref:YciI family protein n=1 Tax=Devosia sp. Root105 TaxID=1736423 RepID=UPI0006F930C7|nr:YciI family protein [Devosia sp. Root105]KQU99006.1 dehydrogenase [Devosia sp. Root105]
MRYACLVYFDPATAFDGSATSNAVLQEAETNRQHLLAGGISAEALTLPSDAVTVRVRGGKTSTTDGPFMETKEVLGGFVLIEAEDIDAAVRIAATNPMAKLGSIEVRPLVDFSKPRPVV